MVRHHIGGGIKKPKALLPWVESTWRGGGDNRGLDEQTHRITQISRLECIAKNAALQQTGSAQNRHSRRGAAISTLTLLLKRHHHTD